jgi:hypothetical protein
MSSGKSQIVQGLEVLELKQKRYKHGRLYVSAIYSDNNLKAIDIRYFIEKDDTLSPTTKGVRIPIMHFNIFSVVLQKMPENIVDDVIWETENRKLVVCYRDDMYGKGVDLRYFKKSNTYTGWERRGIRLALADYEELRRIMETISISSLTINSRKNLFEGKEIIVTRDNATRANEKTFKKRHKDDQYISEVLDRLLGNN